MKSPPLNEREFALLIQEHSRIINKVCYFYATDKMPFEDLRQEIYINIWLGLNQFRGDSKMSTWVYRVAVNSALMCIRSSTPRIQTVSLDFGLPDVSTEMDDAQRENLQTLQSLINRLEDIEKAIILLWLDEYSYDEIAEIHKTFPRPKLNQVVSSLIQEIDYAHVGRKKERPGDLVVSRPLGYDGGMGGLAEGYFGGF